MAHHDGDHDDDDNNDIAGADSYQELTAQTGAIAQPESKQPRFGNITPTMVLRSDTPGLGPGSMIGSYRIVLQIGTGGMATVFVAVHVTLPRRVAIKVMHPHLHRDSGVDTRMLQEASILERLDHPGIARVFDCGVLPDGRAWIAMELVAGESLGAKLARDTTLSATEVCNLVSAVADVLAAVHPRGIVHRDLKPDNILFADADTGFPLRVIDWGIAHLGFEARLTLDGVTCGTPVYMSPEQAAARDIAPPCDIYSLGVIAYEALAGVAPFEGKTLGDVVALQRGEAKPLGEHCPAVPRALSDLIHRMIDKTPSSRPSAADVRDAMQQIALEIVEDGREFASYEVTASPCAVDDTVERRALPQRPLRWTPEMAIIDGSSNLRTCAHGGWELASGELKRTD